MDEYDLDHLRRPTTTRPLLGLTILAVEDSLFACDALRLLCCIAVRVSDGPIACNPPDDIFESTDHPSQVSI